MCRLTKVIVVLIYNNILFDLKSLTSNFHDIDISFRVGFPKKNTKISSLFRIRVNQTTKKLIFSSLCCELAQKKLIYFFVSFLLKWFLKCLKNFVLLLIVHPMTYVDLKNVFVCLCDSEMMALMFGNEPISWLLLLLRCCYCDDNNNNRKIRKDGNLENKIWVLNRFYFLKIFVLSL